jgi:hypothetical protein
MKKTADRITGVVTKDRYFANDIHARFGKTSDLGNDNPRITNNEPSPRQVPAIIDQPPR